MWRVFCIILLLIPSRIYAATSADLVVREDMVLEGSVAYRGIQIEKGATLTIQEGALIKLEGGSISGEGDLKVFGTALAPVAIEGTSWEGIRLSGAVTVSYLFIKGANGPFVFTGHSPWLSHVVIQDALDSRVIFHPPTADAIFLDSLEIRWDTIERQKASIGVSIQGPVGEVTIQNLLFPRSTVLGEEVMVAVRGGYRSLYLIAANTLDNCYLVGSSVFQQSAQYQVNPLCAPKQPSLVFVPGFGASLNFAHLTNPDPPGPAPEGWSLFPFFTNSYRTFLTEAGYRNIHTTVAYYDWRMRPADIVEQYLIPAIDAAKRRDGTDKVYLVGHSYGGVVARYYLESAYFRNDVAGLVQLGAPNAGSVKAYGPWQAAVFPEDWQVISNLTRLYHHLRPEQVNSELKALRAFVPAGLALQSLGPVLERQNFATLQPIRFWPNIHLNQLPVVNPFRRRAPVLFTVAGVGVSTATSLIVGPQRPQALYWQDGEALAQNSKEPGDGTVTLSSASLSTITRMIVSAGHMEIPSESADYVLQQLYPLAVRKSPPPLQGARRDGRNILWFAFDCPITVVITTPSGQRITSDAQESEDVAVYSNPEALWMLVPKEVGRYKIEITALEDTKVRWWQGMESIHIYNLRKDEIRTVSYEVKAVQPEEAPKIAGPALPKDEDQNDPPEMGKEELQQSFSWVFGAISWPSAIELRTASFVRLAVPSKSLGEHVPENKKGPRQLAFGLIALPLILLCRRQVRRPQAHRHPP